MFKSAIGCSVLPESGDSLIIPSVSIGNVGQLACDLLLNTLLSENQVVHIGALQTDLVMPIIGNDPLDYPSASQSQRHATPVGKMCTNIQVFRIPEKKLCIIQIRSPIAEGCTSAFAKELTDWIQSVGFKQVVMVGGADSATTFEEEVMTGQFRMVVNSATPEDFVQSLQEKGLKPLAQSPRLDTDMQDEMKRRTMPFLLGKAGLLNHMFLACHNAGVPMLGLILFCKEGNNVPEACMMAAAVNAALGVFSSPPKAWKPPSAWNFLEGARPEISLFQ